MTDKRRLREVERNMIRFHDKMEQIEMEHMALENRFYKTGFKIYCFTYDLFLLLSHLGF